MTTDTLLVWKSHFSNINFVLNTLMNSKPSKSAPIPAVTEPTNYTKLSKKIIHPANDLANLSPYNPVVREITTDFKPTFIPAKIVISLAVTITSYIKVRITNTSKFKPSYYKPSSNKSSGII
jgi:hypothetical protein